MKNKLYILLGVALVLSSCKFFLKEEEREPIARAGDSYLYEEDIETLATDGLSKEDSAFAVSNFINNWAKQQLLMDKAKLNLPEDKQQQLDALVKKYKNDIYSKSYQEAIVNRSIDTVMRDAEMGQFYEENKDNFRLNEELVRLRYINVAKENYNLDQIIQKLKSFESEDRVFLDSIALQFKSYSLNDSVWVKASQLMQRLPVITSENKEQYLKKSQFFQIEDSLGVYLVHINDVLKRNDTAPLEYVIPTIKQIIINKRKLEYLKTFEKDILQDAIKKKQFEVYE